MTYDGTEGRPHHGLCRHLCTGAARAVRTVGGSWQGRPMPSEQAVLDRVRKLLAVAEHPTTPAAEAEAAAIAAERLMVKHAIDDALLATAEVRGKPEVRTILIDPPYASAKATLLGAVAAAHGVRVVTYQGQSTKASLVGFSSDLGFVDLLYTSLLLQAARDLHRQPRGDRAFRRAFLIGFAGEVGQRLQAAKAEVVAESGGHSTELALRDREAEVADAMREHFPRLGKARITVSDGGGLQAGRRAGASADLASRSERLSGLRPAIDG